jgi:hypothetical protein
VTKSAVERAAQELIDEQRGYTPDNHNEIVHVGGGRQTGFSLGEEWTVWFRTETGLVMHQRGTIAALDRTGMRFERKVHGIAWRDMTAVRKES